MLKNFKTVSFLFVLTALASCGKSGGGSGGEAAPADVAVSEVTEQISSEDPVPTQALNFNVDIKMSNFNAGQEDKVLEAAELIKKVVASDEFKNGIINHKVNGKKTFVDNGGLTNAQIYKTILEGSEKLNPGVDNTMNLVLEVYTEQNIVVGYTYPSVFKIWMNSKYLNARPAWHVTTNMMHEWLHKLGFKHDQSATPTRKYSVPYAVGYLVEKLAKKIS